MSIAMINMVAGSIKCCDQSTQVNHACVPGARVTTLPEAQKPGTGRDNCHSVLLDTHSHCIVSLGDRELFFFFCIRNKYLSEIIKIKKLSYE